MALMGKPTSRPADTTLSIGALGVKNKQLIEMARGKDVQVASHRLSDPNASSKNNGSTQKLARIQRKSKTPIVQPIGFSTESKTLSTSQPRPIGPARRALEDLEFRTHNRALAVAVHDHSTRGQYKCENGSESLGKVPHEQENMLSQDMHECSFADSHLFSSTGYHQADDGIVEDATGLSNATTTDFDPSVRDFRI